MNTENLKEVLNRFGEYVVFEAKNNLVKEDKASGDLYNSISYKVEVEKDIFIVDFLMEDYGKFVDQGVRGADPSLVNSEKTGRIGIQKAPYSKFKYTSKKPPLEILVAWAKKNNVRFRVKKGEKGAGQFKKGSYQSMGFWLQKSIYAQGLKTTDFFTKPYKKGINDFGNELFKAFQLDIEKSIILGQKK